MATERYRDLIAPALIDVGARSTRTGGTEAATAVAQSLAAFSRVGNQVVAPFVAQNLAKTGDMAGAKAGADGVPELKSTLTAYGRAYNNAALRAYAIRSEVDMEENAARVEAEAGTDPEAFRTAMQAMQEATLGVAPPEAQGLLAEAYAKRTGAGLARIQTALTNELRQEDRTLVSEQIGRLTDRVAFLRSQDDPESHAESVEEEAKLFLLLDAAVADGTLSESEGRTARRKVEEGIVFETVVSRFKNEIGDPYGDPIGFIEDLKEANRTANTLTPDKEAELENILLAELRETNALKASRQAQMAAALQAQMDAGDRDLTVALLDGSLTQRGLMEAVAEERVSPAVARTLLNELQASAAGATTMKSDPQALFMFETALLEVTEADLMTAQELSWDDRRRLILKRREEEAGWKGTQVTKEAVARIDRALGIVPGQQRALMSDEELRARDRAMSEFYDVVDALPPEERQAAVLATSQDIIRRVIVNQAQQDLDAARSRLQTLRSDPRAGKLKGAALRQYEGELQRLENTVRELEQKRQQ